MNGLGFSKLFLLVLAVTVYSECVSYEDDMVYASYLFDIPVEISPDGNMYHVGDTIKVSSTIGSSIYDERSMKNIDCGTVFTFPLVQGFGRYDSTEYHDDSHKFEFIPSIGTLIESPGNIGSVDIRYAIKPDNSRALEYFFVPTEPGIYTFYLVYITDFYIDGFFENDDDWTKESADLEFSVNDRTDSGYHLIIDSGYPDLPNQETYERFGSYSFEVVE